MKMLLKYSAAQKKIRGNNNGKLSRLSGGMRVGTATALPRHRKVLNRARVVVKRELVRPLDTCDNSNDSGLGFDHHPVDSHQVSTLTPFSFSHSSQKNCWLEEPPDLKRRRPDVKLESDNASAEFSFPQNPPGGASNAAGSGSSSGPTAPRPGRRLYGKRLSNITHHNSPVSSSGRDPSVYLQILCQPEQQHRARYQTEGSRGAVKDRTGNGFPVVKLVGFAGPATLEVFIGTDQGKIAPHMFYQACRVAGKNSTPCLEKKSDGTVIIDIEFDPAKDMAVTCDCVGILKERNVDVEQRFPEESSARSKKKSTRCRMVFRTTITDQVTGDTEVLQVASQPIVCTQPPGIPEICKKSLTSCVVSGGAELFMFGKNFLKDTQVVFQRTLGEVCVWEQAVIPDKEFLQQSHLVCKVPPYEHQDIKEPVSVLLKVVSSNRHSEPQSFLYTPESTQLWPTLGPIKSELPPSRLMPPPPPLIPMGTHLYAGKIEPPLSSTPKLDAIVNSAADSHIQPLLLSTQAPSAPSQVSNLLSESSSQQMIQDIISTSVAESSPSLMQQIITTEAANSLLTEQTRAASEQLLLAEIINKSERDLKLQYPQAASRQQQQLLEQIIQKTEIQLQLQEANALISESNAQQLIQSMSEPASQELIQRLNETSPLQLIQSMNEASSQQLMQSMNEASSQQLMQRMNESSSQQLMQSMNEASSQLMQSISESTPQQLMQSMSESSPQQLIQRLNDANSQLMQSISESSPEQLMQSMSESSPQQLMQSMSESSPQQLMQSMSESSPQRLMQSMSESSPQQLMQSMSESSPQQLMQNMSESSPRQLMQSMSESSPQQLIQTMSESSPQQLLQSMDTSPQQLMQTLNDSSPQQLMQTMSESSPQQLMQTLNDSSPQQLMQTLSEASPQQLMQSMDTSPQQLMQTLNDSNPQQLMQTMSEASPQQLMQSMDTSPQQLMQTLNDSNPQHLMQSMDSSPQQLMQNMSDSFSQASNSLLSDQCSEASLSPSHLTLSSPQLPYPQAMEDSNSQPPASSLSPDDTSKRLLINMIQKSDDLKLQSLVDQSGGNSQEMLLLSRDQSGGNSLLLSRDRLLSDPARSDAKLLTFMTPLSDKGDDLQFPETSNAAASGDQLLNLMAARPPAQQMLDIIVSTVPSLDKPGESGEGQTQVPFAPPPAATESQSRPQAAGSQQILQLLVKAEEPKDIPSEITQMSATDLLSFIDPNCFNNV